MKRLFYTDLTVSCLVMFLMLFSLFYVDSAFCQSAVKESGSTILKSFDQTSSKRDALFVKDRFLKSGLPEDAENLLSKTFEKTQGAESGKKNIKKPVQEQYGIEKSADQPEKKELSKIEKLFAGQEAAKKESIELRQFGYDLFGKNVTTFTPITNVPVGPGYIIGPGDGFTISVWGKVEASYSVMVDRDGKIIIPEVGAVSVWGLKFSELNNVLKKEIGKYVTDFRLNITMRELRVITVFVVGNVQVPGTYTLSSLSSMLNALFACGGPTKNGSLRKIQLIRNGKVIKTLDLYDFLLKGDKNQDERMRSGDTVFVPLIGELVGVAGDVKRPSIYEMKKKLVLDDLLELAGGITPFGYLQRIQVERVEAHERHVVIDLNLASVTLEEKTALLKTPLQDRDMVRIFPIFSGAENIVRLEGHLTRPGTYEWKEGLRISDLIRSFDMLLAEPYPAYAEIIRLEPPDHHERIIPFSLVEMLKKHPEHDLKLHKLDRVKIYSKLDFEDKKIVTIKGEIRKPGAYPLKENMRISTLVRAAGYLTKESHLSWAMFSRLKEPSGAGKNQLDREFIRINLGEALKGNPQYDLLLQNLDELEVFSKWHFKDKFSISIEGEVRKPGKYALLENMHVSALIHQAGDLTKTASGGKAEIFRMTPDREITTLSFNLSKALAEEKTDDLLLRNEDRVVIHNIWETKEKESVTVIGQVRKTGDFRLTRNMKVSDLVFRAGGMKVNAYFKEAELTRLIIDHEGIKTKLITLNLEKALAGDKEADLLLKNFDSLKVRIIPDWKIKRMVTIQGKVKFPGVYNISKDEKLSSLILRAGGYIDHAYLKGAVFTRKSVKEQQQKRLDDLLNKQEKEIEAQSAKITERTIDKNDLESAKQSIKLQQSLLEKLRKVQPSGRIVIKLSLDKFTDSEYDLRLKDQDKLVVPSTPDTVSVVGEVYNQMSLVFRKDKEVGYYLNKVGGPTERANKDEIYVVKADGTIFSKSQVGFFSIDWDEGNNRWVAGGFMSMQLNPGDTILVPRDLDKINWLKETSQITRILYQMAIPVGVVASLL